MSEASCQEGFSFKYYEFSEYPVSDSCWSLHVAGDGRVYAAACCEHLGGETVKIVRYNEGEDKLDYLFDMDKVTGELRDNGHATQCKIHYSFAPSSDGMLYAATHLSGPPIGEKSYNPWAGWHDPKRCFKGAFLAAYDTNKEKIAWTDLMIPKEGCRCLYHDEARSRLYALTYPRDHLVYYDLAERKLHDIGRIGSVNCQCLFGDSRGRVFFTDDQGHINRFDPELKRIEILPHTVPCEWYQTGWHGVLYDVVGDAKGESVFMTPWMLSPHLMRYWPEDGPYGRLEDLGRLTADHDTSHPASMSLDHVGGLVMGIDNWLYYVRAQWKDEDENQHGCNNIDAARGILTRMNPETLEREDVLTLLRPNAPSHYVSRGGRDAAGNLYFGSVIKTPVGIFRVTVPGADNSGNAHKPLRMWG